ncbi:glyoxylate reductase/hydroxypyruvate reductase-like [Ischnura elegans]|uniref:glyoxylate reductase/hydroxypyruvate reductase-like n=1 Tax=Ischnura elegans TaxID=197161 RepID=UPI001ED87381|nr:glyoxylate reductase/hydroxypyruvate reductase-like [Ischnura elegans]
MSRPKVLISNGEIPEKGLNLLKEKCDLIICPELPYPLRADILKRVKGVDAIFWFTKVKLDKEMMDEAGETLKVVGTMSAGYDHIDIAELKRRGILVGNTPNVLASAVAEIAVGLIIAAARRFHEGQMALMANSWNTGGPQWMLGMEVRGSTVGIVGLGGIGQAVARRLQSFEVGRIIYCGHSPKKEGDAIGAEFVTLEKLLQESDFVIVSCPLTPETKGMFNDEAFSKMKKTAILINVARGDLVDQDALVRALSEGKIWAAGLDVMNPEPLPSNHPLTSLKNCFLTPHLGSATVITRQDMAMLTARNILCGLEGKPLPAPL